MALIAEAASALEAEFTPSLWSRRLPRAELLRHHAAVLTNGSERAVNTVQHKLEVEYGPTPGQKLDIFGTDLPDDAAILVWIHGGFWQEMSRELSRYPAPALHRAKIKTVVVGYDLCPVVSLPEIVDQILNAARFVFEYADRLDSRGVYFAGHSAGAQLVAKLLASADFLVNTPGAWRLQGAFLVSGVFDLTDLVHTSVNRALQLGPDTAAAMSPVLDTFVHLRGRRVRLYVVAAQHDSPVFKKQSREFYELLLNSCLVQNMHFEIKDDMDHFDIVECFANDNNFLRNLLVHDVGKYFDQAIYNESETHSRRMIVLNMVGVCVCVCITLALVLWGSGLAFGGDTASESFVIEHFIRNEASALRTGELYLRDRYNMSLDAGWPF